MKRFVFFASLAVLASNALGQSFSDAFTNAVFNEGAGQYTCGNTAGDTVVSTVTWAAVNASNPIGETSWFPDFFQVLESAHSGTNMDMVCANFDSTTGVNTIDNFLMSPVRTFNNGDKISFWTRTVTDPFFPDRLRVKLSTSGASTAAANFTTVLLDINPTYTVTGYPDVWTQYSITLSGLGGPTSGRFAFNYFVENGGPVGSRSDFIGIDDVEYLSNPVPEPATLAVLGVGAIALARRRRGK